MLTDENGVRWYGKMNDLVKGKDRCCAHEYAAGGYNKMIYQCPRVPGFGPGELYCREHAPMHKKLPIALYGLLLLWPVAANAQSLPVSCTGNLVPTVNISISYTCGPAPLTAGIEVTPITDPIPAPTPTPTPTVTVAELIEPIAGATLTPGVVLFRWNGAPGDLEYILKIGTSPDQADVAYKFMGLNRDSLDKPVTVAAGVIYVVLQTRIGPTWQGADIREFKRTFTVAP